MSQGLISLKGSTEQVGGGQTGAASPAAGTGAVATGGVGSSGDAASPTAGAGAVTTGGVGSSETSDAVQQWVGAFKSDLSAAVEPQSQGGEPGLDGTCSWCKWASTDALRDRCPACKALICWDCWRACNDKVQCPFCSSIEMAGPTGPTVATGGPAAESSGPAAELSSPAVQNPYSEAFPPEDKASENADEPPVGNGEEEAQETKAFENADEPPVGNRDADEASVVQKDAARPDCKRKAPSEAQRAKQEEA